MDKIADSGTCGEIILSHVPENERQDENSSVKVAVPIKPLSDKEGINSTAIHTLINQPDYLVTVSSIDTEHSSSTVGTAATIFSTVASDCSTVQAGEQKLNHIFIFDHVFPPSINQV